MFARLIVGVFGSPWRLKRLCEPPRSSLATRMFRGLWKWYQYENGSSVAWNARFEGPPCFPHGMRGIFVSGGAVVGKNCVIYQQVTIGSIVMPDASRTGAPVIGRNVFIGAGAKIIGAVRVGDNVRVGANAVVYEDVPDNCVVVGSSQRNVQRTEALDNRFYSYRANGWHFYDNARHLPVEDPDIVARLEAGASWLESA